MGVFSGWQSAVSSAAQIVASLAGQTVSMLKLTLTQISGQDALVIATGAKVQLGGANGSLSSDGTTISTPAPLQAGSFKVAGAQTMTTGNVTTGDIELASNVANLAASVALAFWSQVDLTTAGAQVAAFYKDALVTKVFAIDQAGRLLNPTPGNSTASPGNAVLNTASGRSAIALGAATVTITNSLVSATSLVFVTIQTADATLTSIKSVVPGAGSFVVTGNANATAATNIGWLVFNV